MESDHDGEDRKGSVGGAVELTIPVAVARAAREFGDAEALADPLAGPGGECRLSYRELDERGGRSPAR